MKFIIEQLEEHLTRVAGFALVGEIIHRHTALKARLDKTRVPGVINPNISHGDIVTSYIGLLCQGCSDFDHIELFRDDPFFAQALEVEEVPSSPTLRQRLGMAAKNEVWKKSVLEEAIRFLKELNTPITLTLGSREHKRHYVSLDIDVCPFDNPYWKKKEVSRTHKGHGGYAPIAYNALRLLGQLSLSVKNVHLRSKVQRRRLRTVIQNLITIASRLVRHARRFKVRFGRHSLWYRAFEQLCIAMA